LGHIGGCLGRTDTHAIQFIDLIGAIAVVLTIASFVPQTIHTFRIRDVSAISLVMYSAFTAGVAL
jgi:MtN3 and saliva related transmembrane protein